MFKVETFMLSLCFLLLWRAEAGSYSISYSRSSSTYTVSLDGSNLWSGADLDSSPLILSIGGIGNSSLTASLNTTPGVWWSSNITNALVRSAISVPLLAPRRISSQVYAAVTSDNAPYQVIAIEPDVVCAPKPPFTPSGFKCKGSLANYSITYPVLTSTVITIQVDMSASDPNLVSVLTVLLSHLDGSNSFMSKFVDAGDWNDARFKTSRVAVGFMWFFITIGSFVGLALQVAWLQAWLNLPSFATCCNCCEDKDANDTKSTKCSHKVYKIITENPNWMWAFIFLAISNTISWSAGIFGWAAIMLAYSLYIIALFIVYLNREKCCKKKGQVVPAATKDEGKTSETNSSCCKYNTDKELKFAVRTGNDSTWTKGQCNRIILWSVWLLVFFLLVIITFFSWSCPDYELIERYSSNIVSEFTPAIIQKASLMVYSFQGLGTMIRTAPLWVAQTEYCGSLYNTELTSDEKKFSNIQTAYIAKYNIDMSIYARPLYSQYSTVNDWFSRALVSPISSVRPIAYLNDPTVIVSPADARLNIFPSIYSDAPVWFKGETLSVSQLLVGYDAAMFDGGSLLMVRLAPSDYHRFHAPTNGTITYSEAVSGPYYSVNGDAMRASCGALYNKRTVAIVRQSAMRQYAYVPIGATCVGSISMTMGVNIPFGKGAEIGYFQFGGSSVAMVFPPNSVLWDDDLVYASSKGQEILVRMGMKIGEWLI